MSNARGTNDTAQAIKHLTSRVDRIITMLETFGERAEELISADFTPLVDQFGTTAGIAAARYGVTPFGITPCDCDGNVRYQGTPTPPAAPPPAPSGRATCGGGA